MERMLAEDVKTTLIELVKLLKIHKYLIAKGKLFFKMVVFLRRTENQNHLVSGYYG
jgi:hypothetical protein